MKVCSVCQRCFEDGVEVCETADHGRLKARPEIDRDAVEGYLFERLLEKRPDLELYRAGHPQTEKTVLITLLQVASAREAEKLQHDRRAASAVNQPNLARLYESGRIADEEFYLVDEDCAGATLGEYLKGRGRLSEREAILVARQTAEALEALHGAGAAHGAINPNGIVVDDSGPELSVKLRNIDFGGVRARAVVGSVNRVDEQTDALVYLAPEQFEGSEAGQATDIYSLGVVLYEMLIGALPYERPAAPAILDFVFSDKPFEKLRFDVRALLAHLLRESLQKRSSLRPPSAGNLARQLRHVEKLVAPAPIAFREYQAPKTARAEAASPPPAPQNLADEILAERAAEAVPQTTAEDERTENINAAESVAFEAPPREAEKLAQKTDEPSVREVVLPRAAARPAPEKISETEEEPIAREEPAQDVSVVEEPAPVDHPTAVESVVTANGFQPEIEETAAEAEPEEIQSDRAPYGFSSEQSEDRTPVTRKLVPIPALAEMSKELEKNAAEAAPEERELKENAVEKNVPRKPIEPAASDVVLPRAFIHLKESYTALKIRNDLIEKPTAAEADEEYEIIDDEAIEYETIDQPPDDQVDGRGRVEPAYSTNGFEGFGAYAGTGRPLSGGRGLYVGGGIFAALVLLGLLAWNFAGGRQQASTPPQSQTPPTLAQPVVPAPAPETPFRENQSAAEKRETAATTVTGKSAEESTTIVRQNARTTPPPAEAEARNAPNKAAQKPAADKKEQNAGDATAKNSPAPRRTEKPQTVARQPAVEKPKPDAARGDGLTRPRVVANGN